MLIINNFVMAQEITSVKINQLPKGTILSTDLFIHGKGSLMYADTMSDLANFIGAVGELGFKGSLAKSDTPTEDGWYLASENGTYTNAGGLVVNLSNGLSIISVTEGQTVFSLVVVPIDLSGYVTIEERDKQLFHYEAEFTDGQFINSAGNTASNAAFSASDFIPIAEADDILLTGTFSAGGYTKLAFYDNNKIFISGIDSASAVTYDREIINVPVNSAYVRASMLTSALFTFKLESNIYNNIKQTQEFINTNELKELNDYSTDRFGYYNTDGSFTPATGFFAVTEFIELDHTNKYFLTLRLEAGTYAVVTYLNKYNQKTGGENRSLWAAAGGTKITKHELIPPTDDTAFFAITYGEAYTSSLSIEVENKVMIEKPVSYYPLALPKYLDAVVNHQTNIFTEQLIESDDNQVFTIDSNAQMVRKNRAYRYSPTTTAANFTKTFYTAKFNGESAVKQNLIVRTISDTGGSGTKNVMLLGDSLTDNSYLAAETFNLIDTDGDYTINQIGTRSGGGALHEGRGGWAWGNYVNSDNYAGITNPFRNGGALDIANYVTSNGFSGIDVVMINLGTNDVNAGKGQYLDSTLDSIIATAKTFIDAFLAYNSSIKICIALPSIGAPYFPFTTGASEQFRNSIVRLSKKYIEEFDEGRYNANVSVFMMGSQVNREYSYPYTEEAVNNRLSETWKVYSDGIHPRPEGYYQFADAYYNKLRSILAGN